MSSKIRPFLSMAIMMLSVSLQGVQTLSAEVFEPLLNPQKLNSLPAKDRVLLDTRPAWRFLLGHIPGAVNTGDWRDFTVTIDGVPGMLNEDRDFLARKLQALGIDYGKTIVVYGDAKDQWRTDGRFFWMFERLGFGRVGILDGGWDAWVESGGDTERGSGGSPLPSALAPQDIRFNDAALADQKWIFERLGSQSIAVIDNRTRKEFDGAILYGEKRGGHIPGAVHIDWREFFTSGGKLKSREEAAALLDKYGVRPEQEAVVYCTGGVRSAMAYFVFKHLGRKVRNYDGSWWDWSHNPALPLG
ncbi:MAG: sulfurtransferase [Nitrospinae bacterium]|nr:sulfurtransferase [Nitrospinota bacterium]